MADPDVIIVLFKYHPHGGGQRDAVRLARALTARGVRAQILVNEIDGTPPDDVAVEALNQEGVQNYMRNGAFLAELGRKIAAGLGSYVVSFVRTPLAHHYVAVDPCFKNRVRERRPLWLAELNPRDRFFLNAEERTLLEGDRKLSFLSAAHLADYTSAYPGIDQESDVLPAEVRADCKRNEGSQAQGAALRKALGIEQGTDLCLAVGSGFRTKGLDRSIQCIRALTDAGRDPTLVVVGNDDPKAFARLARRLGVEERVRFLGGRDDLPAIYSAADVLLHPARFEAAGKVLLEALAAGLPVITTDRCGYATHVQASLGGQVLGSPFDRAAYAQVTLELLSDPARREAQANLAAQYGANLHEDSMIEALAGSVARGLERHQAS